MIKARVQKSVFGTFLLICLVWDQTRLAAQDLLPPPPDASEKACEWGALAPKIMELANNDQILRSQPEPDFELIRDSDKKNSEILREVIARCGWPTYSAVGAKAARAAWLIVQHSPNLEFQSHVLALLEQAPTGESHKQQYALLFDRVALRQDRPQRYGTQVLCSQTDGTSKLAELENADILDQLRANVGLGPISEYLKKFEQSCARLIPKE